MPTHGLQRLRWIAIARPVLTVETASRTAALTAQSPHVSDANSLSDHLPSCVPQTVKRLRPTRKGVLPTRGRHRRRRCSQGEVMAETVRGLRGDWPRATPSRRSRAEHRPHTQPGLRHRRCRRHAPLQSGRRRAHPTLTRHGGHRHAGVARGLAVGRCTAYVWVSVPVGRDPDATGGVPECRHGPGRTSSSPQKDCRPERGPHGG